MSSVVMALTLKGCGDVKRYRRFAVGVLTGRYQYLQTCGGQVTINLTESRRETLEDGTRVWSYDVEGALSGEVIRDSPKWHKDVEGAMEF
jgi:hypothetical protein